MYNFQELIIAKCSYQKPIRFLLLFPSSLLLLLTISERDFNFNIKNSMNTILIANVSRLLNNGGEICLLTAQFVAESKKAYKHTD